MLKDYIKFSKRCEECQKHVEIQHVSDNELQEIIKPWTFRGWALDLIGEIIPTLPKSHRYILVGIYYFTKWTETVPLVNVDQVLVTNFIQSNIISRFGIPKTITIYQGSIFIGRKMVEFTSGSEIKLLTFNLYYAQANDQVEVANKVLISLIKKHVAKKVNNWHNKLDPALWACRTSN